MPVICDTSPLSYLILIGETNLLGSLFGKILIPPAIAEELSHPKSPEVIRNWTSTPPDWLQVLPAPPIEESSPPEAFYVLDPGEQEAIQLAFVK